MTAAQLCGQHTYLDRILYTDATSSILDRNGAPYEIDFLHDPSRSTATRAPSFAMTPSSMPGSATSMSASTVSPEWR